MRATWKENQKLNYLTISYCKQILSKFFQHQAKLGRENTTQSREDQGKRVNPHCCTKGNPS